MCAGLLNFSALTVSQLDVLDEEKQFENWSNFAKVLLSFKTCIQRNKYHTSTLCFDTFAITL